MLDFDDDELLVMFCIMQIWCDDIFILFWINYGDVGFMPILMSDDDVFVLCCLLSSHIHCIGDDGLLCQATGLLCQVTRLLCQVTRLLCQATMSFMPSVPNHGQSDGYHMHNIVVSHGVGYVYV